MTRETDGPGHRLPGPSKAITSGADATGISMLPQGGDTGRLRRFGQPSSYSLTAAELAAEVRRRRREGWQHWEIRARFDFGGCRTAA
jgi:hypothetical protein